MLKVFRDNLKYLSWVLWLVILVFVLFVFVDFGGTVGPGGGGTDHAAKVGGEAVSYAEFERAYRRSEDLYRRVYGDQFSRETARQMGLPLQVLDGLIDERIMREEARRMKLRTTDQEIRDAILEQPTFKDEQGRFVGQETYERILRANGYNVEGFENEIRRDLLSNKVRTVLAQTVFISEQEIERAYREQAEFARLRLLRLPAGRYAAEVEILPGDLESHFADHRDDFRIPERRVVDYLLVDPASLRATMELTDEELLAYYEANRDEFTQEEQVRARHILIRVEDEQDDEAARATLEQARERIRQGADFAALAGELSEDPGSKDRGGDLGFFGRGRMVPEFEQAAFGAQPGELVGPVRSAFGYHLIEVTERRGAGLSPFDEVRERIRGTLLTRDSAERAERQASELAARLRREELKTREELEGLAGELPAASFQTTPPFGREEIVPGIGRATAFSVAAFELALDQVSDPVKVPRGWAVLRLAEIQTPRLPELDEVRTEVEAAVRGEKQAALARQRLEEARREIDAGDTTLDELAEELGVQIEEAGEVRREGRVGSLGVQPEIAEAALALDEGAIGGPLPGAGDSVLFEVVERKRFDPEEFRQQRAATRTTLEQERLNSLVQSLVNRRRAELGVSYDRQFLTNFGAPEGQDSRL